jgi:chromate transporter
MAVVTSTLARAALVDVGATGLMLVSAALLFRYKVNSAWLVFGGGVLGGLIQWVR